MPYRRWDPFQDLISLHQELFGEGAERGVAESAWTPAVDIYETSLSYVLKAELPGMEPDRIRLEYTGQNLILSGERPPRPKDLARRFHQMERSYGPFRRSFRLPEGVCCEEIEASYDQGILEIILPKKPDPKPKAIIVQTTY